MFPQWLRSPGRVNSTTPKSPSHFSFSSLKDINTILKEEEEDSKFYPPQSPKRPSIFHRVKLSTSVLRAWSHRHSSHSSPPSITIPNSDQGVVVYLTSLRVVRKTFEDCRAVRSILRSLRVPIDERDLSLDPNFLDELQGIIGRRSFTLPLVFIGGRYIGGAEEVKQLHECGELNKLIGGLPLVVGSTAACDFCDGLRFVLCRQCNGSHKIYSDKSGFRTCNVCNANGLIRCPSCSPGHHRVTYSS